MDALLYTNKVCDLNFHFMPVHSINNTEKELNLFITRLEAGGVVQTVEIHEIDMSGWVLFECFMHPAQTVVYIGWDEEAQAPEWIDMEEGMMPEYATLLTGAIQQFKRKIKAA